MQADTRASLRTSSGLVTLGGCVTWQGGDKDDLPEVTEFLARYGV